MSDLIRKFDDFQKRAQQLDEYTRQINGRLFLFDEYHPKHIPPGIVNDEVIFWYLIVDLYGLFFDAGKYLRFVPVWNEQTKKTVINFYVALNEIRSVFCHNKPPTAYLHYHVTNPALRYLVIEWNAKSAPARNLLTRNFNTPSPFRDLFDIYIQAAEKILTLLEGEVLTIFENYVKEDQDESIYEKWFVPIFKWYVKGNMTVYTRAWQSFCREKGMDMQIDRTVALGTSRARDQLTAMLSSYGDEKYGKLMYFRHFSLHAGTSDRRMLTPYTLFAPLLSEIQPWGGCSRR